MNEAAQFLIDGYLDDVLTIEQHEALSASIRSSPENARTFAVAVMLHDRLRNEMVISGERQGGQSSPVSDHSSFNCGINLCCGRPVL
jgi:hypothetical protein